MNSQVDELYVRAYMEGYTAAKREAAEATPKPYMTVDDIVERYGGKIGRAKAYQIARDVRITHGGGKLDSDRVILLTELEDWEKDISRERVRP